MTAASPFRTPERAALGEERRRMVRGRRFLQAALANPAPDWAVTHAFILACVDHLRIAVSRLIVQDRSLGAHARRVLPATKADDLAFLDELDQRLQTRMEEVEAFVAATQQLAATGAAGLDDFSAVTHRFFFDSPSMKSSRPEKHSLGPMIEGHGSPDAYAEALKESDACGSEADAFARVEALAWPGLDELAEAIKARELAERPARRRG